jgi:hypothetical protein
LFSLFFDEYRSAFLDETYSYYRSRKWPGAGPGEEVRQ